MSNRQYQSPSGVPHPVVRRHLPTRMWVTNDGTARLVILQSPVVRATRQDSEAPRGLYQAADTTFVC